MEKSGISFTSHQPHHCSTGQAFEAWRRINGGEFWCFKCGEVVPESDWTRANLQLSISEDRTSVVSMRVWHREPKCLMSPKGWPEGGTGWLTWTIGEAQQLSGITI